jgi:hypothetical protein
MITILPEASTTTSGFCQQVHPELQMKPPFILPADETALCITTSREATRILAGGTNHRSQAFVREFNETRRVGRQRYPLFIRQTLAIHRVFPGTYDISYVHFLFSFIR